MSDKRKTKRSDGNREKSVASLRRRLLLFVAAACLIPACVCVILSVRYDRLKSVYDDTVSELRWYQSREMESETAVEKASPADSGVLDQMPQLSAEIAVSEDEDDTRRVYLTFDDGPSKYTDEILDVLDQYDVKATFFVTGKNADKYLDQYKRIVDEGHTLGMHSYSHRYEEIYSSLDAYQKDLHLLQTFLYENTGRWPWVYRFPGGSSNTVSKISMDTLIDYINHDHIVYYDWNVSSGDDTDGVTKDTIVTNVIANVPKYHTCIILFHDASDKYATVEALPEIIEQIQAMDNTVLCPITEDTVPIQHKIK